MKMGGREGSTAIVIILIIVIVAIVAGIWYYELRSASHSSPQSTSTVESSSTIMSATSSPEAGWLTYKNDQYGFEIRYPSDWIVATSGAYDYAYGQFVAEPSGSAGYPVILNVRPTGDTCVTAQKFADSGANVGDVGPFSMQASNVDAWQYQPELGKGGTVGGTIILANKNCNASSTPYVVEVYDSGFLNRTSVQQAEYFDFVSTFQFLK